jgi:deoxyribonuclease V
MDHPWKVTPEEAKRLQRELRAQVRVEPLPRPIRTVGGTDLSFAKGGDLAYAGIVVLSYPDLEVVDRVGLSRPVEFPYIPGLLAFREAPPLLECWERLRVKPDVLLVDGHGWAHPRRFGIACHLGVLCDVPSIGCAKRVLVGRHGPVGEQRGSYAYLKHQDEIIGAALRTREGVAPIYISIGHRTTLEDALRFVLRCTTSYRLPEPTRQAHLYVNTLRRGETPLPM